MKRFIVFAGWDPVGFCGGWYDFVKDFDTFQDAKEFVKKLPIDEYKWGHVVDSKEKSICYTRKIPIPFPQEWKEERK